MNVYRMAPARVAAALLATALAAPATAQNIGFLRRGPVAYLSESEQILYRDTLRRALEEAADGETVEWRSDESAARGSFEVLDTHEDYGTTCRTVRTRTTAAGRQGGGALRLCRAEDGEWRLAPARRSR